MRLHTDLTRRDLYDIAYGIEGVYPEVIERGSRKRARAFDFYLSADERKGRRRGNSGRYGAALGQYAATWDEWGMVFARLFALDPDMDCDAYHGAEDFHYKTGQRFSTFGILLSAPTTTADHWQFRDPADLAFTPHDQHRWEFAEEDTTDDGVRVYESRCRCGAVKRYVSERRTA